MRCRQTCDAGADDSDAMMTSFFITDFLARHFEAFMVKPLGLDRHPELKEMYFAHYEKARYLAQTDDPELTRKAETAAQFLGLPFERRQYRAPEFCCGG